MFPLIVFTGVLSVVLSGIGLLYLFIFYRMTTHPLNIFPGPKRLTYPIMGILGYHNRAKGHLQKPVKLLRSKYGRVRRVFLPFGDARLDISDHHWIRYILVSNAKNFNRGGKTHWKQLSGLRLMVGEASLVMVSGIIHRRLRKLANPAFRQTLLTEFVGTFRDVSERLFDRWDRLLSAKQSGQDAIIYVREDFSKLTLDIIGLTAFGHDFNSLTCDTAESAAFKYITETSKFGIDTFLPGYKSACQLVGLLSHWEGISHLTTLLYHIRQLRFRIRQLIKEKSAAVEVDKDQIDHKPFLRRSNLMQLILEAECDGKMSAEELEDTIITFISKKFFSQQTIKTEKTLVLLKAPVMIHPV